MKIEVRRKRAIQWLLLTIEKKEEPLYCPSFFTAVDPEAMLHLFRCSPALSPTSAYLLPKRAGSPVCGNDYETMERGKGESKRENSIENYKRFLRGEPMLFPASPVALLMNALPIMKLVGVSYPFSPKLGNYSH